MSLVEQTIARLRQAADVAGATTPDAAATAFAEVAGDASKPTRRLLIDTESLRAMGYLPEESQDRRFADQFRQIKRPLIDKALALKPSTQARDPRLIMVTSALPGDGKTFTSINLALSLARERDVSVLLIDADAPKPHVSAIFGVQKERGLLDALVNEGIKLDSLVLPTNVRGLSILPAGTSAEGISELLSSNRMLQLMKALTVQNPRRILLLDSAPLLITSEGRSLMKIAGQVLLVVRAGMTPAHAVQEAAALLAEEQAGGIVLNDAPLGPVSRYYGYGKYGEYGSSGDAKTT